MDIVLPYINMDPIHTFTYLYIHVHIYRRPHIHICNHQSRHLKLKSNYASNKTIKKYDERNALEVI